MSIKDGGPVRYEISEGELDVLAITGPEGTRYFDGEEIEARAIRQQARDIEQLRAECDLLTHKVICCGVAAWHSDPLLTTTGAYAGKWNSPQADCVRKLRAERDQLRADLATAVAERDRMAQRIKDLDAECSVIAKDCTYAEQQNDTLRARLAAIDAAPTVGWLRPYGRGLSTSEPSGERMPQYELIARPAKD